MNKILSFDYNKVNFKEKTKFVQKIFSDVALYYDLMNDIMSFGTHRIWKKKFVDLVNPTKNEVIVDIGSGSGDIVKEMLKRKKNIRIDVVDLNKEMLNMGKKNIINKNVNFHLANAEELNFQNNFYDKYLISFCLRNITNIEKALCEAFRVLKPGGIFFCLEFSSPETLLISNIYKKYKSNFLPFAGKIISNNKAAYNYLSQSIDLFPNQEQLKNKLTEVGFINVSYTNLFNGIVCIHTGYKI